MSDLIAKADQVTAAIATASSDATTKANAAQAAAIAASQPVNANLSAIGGLTSAAAKGIQFTGSGTAAVFDLTTAGKALLDDAAASDQRTTLGLVIGTDVRPQGSGDPTRASLGLATSDTPQFAGIEVGAASDTTLARASAGVLQVEGNRLFAVGGTDVPIADGGTGASDAPTARTNLGIPGSGFTVGDYYMPNAAALSGVTLTLSALYVCPFMVQKTATFDIIGCEVTTAGAANAVVRLGIYSDTGGGRPGALLLDAGTVITTTPAQNREIAISQQLVPGIYWLACDAQVVTANFRCMNPPIPPINVGSLAAPGNTHSPAYFRSSVTGVFSAADPYGTPSGIAGQCPRVYLRCASVP